MCQALFSFQFAKLEMGLTRIAGLFPAFDKNGPADTLLEPPDDPGAHLSVVMAFTGRCFYLESS
jgi:hypothetical protein